MSEPVAQKPVSDGLVVRLSHTWCDGPRLMVQVPSADGGWIGAYADESPHGDATCELLAYDPSDEFSPHVGDWPEGVYVVRSGSLVRVGPLHRGDDLLQRHLLCAATGLHDPRPDGTCRDCEAVVGDAPVCASDVTIRSTPDEPSER